MLPLNARTRTRTRSRSRTILAILAVACALALGSGSAARGAGFEIYEIFAGDPVDSMGRPLAILPGVPLISPQQDGKFNPPIVDPTKIGDVDLVLRAGLPMVGPVMPAPPLTPPVAVAGGTHVVSGSKIDFTVIASDGKTTPTGQPIFDPDMDNIPVIVLAFADLDGDGIVGPTSTDAAGAADNARELQESNYLAGIQVAYFQSGVARGSIAVWKGGPATAGGLRVILTAVAYVGPYDLMFLAGNVPDGPGVSTLQPVFPELDPLRTIEGHGEGGMPSPTTRLGFEFEAAFDPPVGHPLLGTPFAVPTDGTSPTIDRATIQSAAFSRARFLMLSSPAAFPVDLGMEVPLFRGAGGLLYEPLASAAVSDDGPSGGTHVRLTPVDVLDNVTDPGVGAQATLVADPGLAITSPDTDADPSRETVPIATAAGVDVVLDDTGGSNDSGVGSAVTVLVDGFPVDRLPVSFTPGGGPPPGGIEIRDASFDGNPSAFVVGCSSKPMLSVSVADPERDATSVVGTMALGGLLAGKVSLRTSFAVPPNQGGVTQQFVGPVQIRPRSTGLLDLSLVATDAERHMSAPFALSFPVVTNAAPQISDVMVSDTSVFAGVREMVTVSARVTDDCGVSRVSAELDAGRGFRRVASMRDDGRNGDTVAKDGVFTGLAQVQIPVPGTFPLRIAAQDLLRASAFSAPIDVHAMP